MSIPSNSNAATVTPSVTGVSLNKMETQPPSKYPPGVEHIITPQTNVPTKLANNGPEHGPAPRHTATSSSSGNNKINVQKPKKGRRRGLTPEELAVMDEMSELVRVRDLPYTAQQKTVRTIQSSSQRISDILDGMYTTLREYWSSETRINYVELPAYRHMRKAMNQLVAILDSFASDVNSPVYYHSNADLNLMVYEFKEVFTDVISEGERILAVWNRREAGQVVGQPLSERDARHRRYLIRDCSPYLENITKMAITARRKVQRERAFRYPVARVTWDGQVARAKKCFVVMGRKLGLHNRFCSGFQCSMKRPLELRLRD